MAIVDSNWICPPAPRLSNATAWLSGKFQAKPVGGGRGSVVVILFHMTLTDPSQAQAALFAALGVILKVVGERFLNLHILQDR